MKKLMRSVILLLSVLLVGCGPTIRYKGIGPHEMFNGYGDTDRVTPKGYRPCDNESDHACCEKPLITVQVVEVKALVNNKPITITNEEDLKKLTYLIDMEALKSSGAKETK